MAISFSCPRCNKVLKSALPIPAGKKVKCAGCGTVFPMRDAEEERAASGIKARPAPSAARKSALSPPVEDEAEARPRKATSKARASEDNGARARRSTRDWDRDDEDDERPRRSVRRRDEDDEDDDVDVRLRKGRRAQSGSLGLLIGIGAGALLLVVVGITGFVWPGFFRSGGGGAVAGGGLNDPNAPNLLNFVPARCDFVMGSNLASVRGMPGFMDGFLQGFQRQMPLSPAQADLVRNAERAVLAVGGTEPMAPAAFSLRTVNPVEAEKIRQTFEAGPARNVQGKSIYSFQRAGGTFLLAIPHNRTIVLGINMQENDFVSMLDGKAQLPAGLVNEVNAMQDKTMWATINLQANGIQQEMRRPQMRNLPGGQQLQGAVQRARSASVFADFAVNAKIQVGLECANDNDAGQAEQAVNDLWRLQAQQFLQMAPLMLANQAGGNDIAGLINDISRSFRVQRQGPRVSASIEISQNALANMGKVQQRPGVPGGFR